MATMEFKDTSKYGETLEVPAEDYVYNKWLENVQLCQNHEKTVIGVALFGTGRAGTIHLSSLLRNSRIDLLYIVEENKSRWNALRSHWNLTTTQLLTTADAHQVYNDKNVRAVIVTTPTYTHESIVMSALNHNKGVFCEKPVAESIEKTRNCFKKAQQVGQPLLTALNRRFDPAFSSVRDRVRKGEIGHVSMIKTCSRDSPSPSIDYLKVSGGIFHDCAIHDIDMLLYILGEYPTKVAVAATANVPEIEQIGDFDTVAIVLTFPSGTVGVIDLSRFCSYGYDQRLEVFGFKGMIRADGQQPVQGVEVSCGLDRKTCPIYHSFASRYQAGYVNEMEHFLNVIEGKEKLKIEPRDVLAASKIAAACQESAETGKSVEIQWCPEELPSA